MSVSSVTVGGKIKYKLVLLGNQHVGKSSIIDRFINDRFDDSYNVRSEGCRQPSVLTFLSGISFITIKPIGCSSGTLPGRKGSKH